MQIKHFENVILVPFRWYLHGAGEMNTSDTYEAIMGITSHVLLLENLLHATRHLVN